MFEGLFPLWQNNSRRYHYLNLLQYGRVCRCSMQKYQRIYTTYSIFLMNMYLLICATSRKSIVTQRAVLKKAVLFCLCGNCITTPQAAKLPAPLAQGSRIRGFDRGIKRRKRSVRVNAPLIIYTSSMKHISAASPRRGPVLMIRQ